MKTTINYFPVTNPHRPKPAVGLMQAGATGGEIWKPAFEFADLSRITAQVPGSGHCDTMRVQLWLMGRQGRNHGTAFSLN